MIKPEDVTIIIPHLGATPEQEFALDQCLPSLKETCDIRIIVVKNGPDCKHQGDIRLFNQQGQCMAVNAGIATTNTPWVYICQDDMIYAENWFERLTMQDPLSIDPQNEFIDDNWCLSPKLIEPRSGAPTFETYFCGGAGGDFDKVKWQRFAHDYRDRKDLKIRTGFNFPLLIKRELWDLVGGYDINFDPWGSNSDSDLEYKIKLAGVQPYQNTNCIVYHFSQTSGTFQPENGAYYQKNFQVFKDKWGFDRTDIGIWEANFKIPTKEEGRIFTPDWEGHYGTGSF